MYTVDDLHSAAAETIMMPYGPARSAATAHVVEMADAADDLEWRIHSRLLLMRCYHQGNDGAKILPLLAWTLKAVEARPDLVDEDDLHELRWMYKFAPGIAMRIPTTTNAQLAAMLEGARDYFHAAGASLRPIHARYVNFHTRRGDYAAAKAALEQWRITPRDENSDCAGCDPLVDIRWALETGDDRTAIAVGRTVVEADPEELCATQPYDAQMYLQLALARQGLHDESWASHVNAYAWHRRNAEHSDAIGHHLLFLGVTGRVDRGAQLARDHASWIGIVEDADTLISLWIGYLRLARALIQRGRGDERLGVELPGENRWHPIATLSNPTWAEVASHLEPALTELAARFDARDGSARHPQPTADRIAALLEQPEITPDSGVMQGVATLTVPADPETAEAPASSSRGTKRSGGLFSRLAQSFTGARAKKDAAVISFEDSTAPLPTIAGRLGDEWFSQGIDGFTTPEIPADFVELARRLARPGSEREASDGYFFAEAIARRFFYHDIAELPEELQGPMWLAKGSVASRLMDWQLEQQCRTGFAAWARSQGGEVFLLAAEITEIDSDALSATGVATRYAPLLDRAALVTWTSETERLILARCVLSIAVVGVQMSLRELTHRAALLWEQLTAGAGFPDTETRDVLDLICEARFSTPREFDRASERILASENGRSVGVMSEALRARAENRMLARDEDFTTSLIQALHLAGHYDLQLVEMVTTSFLSQALATFGEVTAAIDVLRSVLERGTDLPMTPVIAELQFTLARLMLTEEDHEGAERVGALVARYYRGVDREIYRNSTARTIDAYQICVAAASENGNQDTSAQYSLELAEYQQARGETVLAGRAFRQAANTLVTRASKKVSISYTDQALDLLDRAYALIIDTVDEPEEGYSRDIELAGIHLDYAFVKLSARPVDEVIAHVTEARSIGEREGHPGIVAAALVTGIRTCAAERMEDPAREYERSLDELYNEVPDLEPEYYQQAVVLLASFEDDEDTD